MRETLGDSSIGDSFRHPFEFGGLKVGIRELQNRETKKLRGAARAGKAPWLSAAARQRLDRACDWRVSWQVYR